jgi:hypothetical protein
LQAPKNVPKLGFLVRKYTIWQTLPSTQGTNDDWLISNRCILSMDLTVTKNWFDGWNHQKRREFSFFVTAD